MTKEQRSESAKKAAKSRMNRQERRFHLMIEQSRPLTRTHRAIASALERPATRKA